MAVKTEELDMAQFGRTLHKRHDPYRDRKIYHMAHKISPTGGVSALCFTKPRAIDLTRALWTVREKAVTCPKCKRALARDSSSMEKDKP